MKCEKLVLLVYKGVLNKVDCNMPQNWFVSLAYNSIIFEQKLFRCSPDINFKT